MDPLPVFSRRSCDPTASVLSLPLQTFVSETVCSKALQKHTVHETRDKMGVEIETITPGDGKIALMHLQCCKVVYYLSCVRLTALCYCSVSCSLFLLALLLQGGLSPKKDRHVWCIMLVSWISDVLLVGVLMLYFCERCSLYGFLYMEMYNYWHNLEKKRLMHISKQSVFKSEEWIKIQYNTQRKTNKAVMHY